MEDVTLELEVIQAVGRALAKLPDPEAQRRVIRWINDRFQPSPMVVSTDRSDRPGAGRGVTDAGLGVDELSEFFDATGQAPRLTMHREAEAEPMSNPAAVEPKMGIDTLVRGFVSDFQRIALEWQGA